MLTQLKEWPISTPTDIKETRRDFMEEVLMEVAQRQLALRLRSALDSRRKDAWTAVAKIAWTPRRDAWTD